MIGDQLQRAIFSALTGASVCDGRVYDGVPKTASFPYVTIGEEDVVDDGNSCGDAYEVFAKIHAWSRPISKSKLEIKDVVAAVVPAIAGINTVQDFIVVSNEFQGSNTLGDPDGLTEHSVITFRFLLDPAS